MPKFFFFKVLTFGKNVTRLEVKIKILHDAEREIREAFTVHLTKDRYRFALIESNKVIVYIEENLYRTGVTFPLIPTVVSLKDYDDMSKAKAEPIQGYPLICVTVSIQYFVKILNFVDSLIQVWVCLPRVRSPYKCSVYSTSLA